MGMQSDSISPYGNEKRILVSVYFAESSLRLADGPKRHDYRCLPGPGRLC